MPTITTFLTFDNRAEEAVKHYVSIFKDSKIVKTLYYGEEAPMPKGTVMTIEFELLGVPYTALNGGSYFKFSDAVSLSVAVDTQQEVDEYTAKLIAGGGEQRPCGWVSDKFGLAWQVTPTILIKMLGDKDKAKAARVMKAMMDMYKIDIAAIKRAYEG